MEVILSNANSDMEPIKLIRLANKLKVKQVELMVDYHELMALESLNGNDAIDDLMDKLCDSDVELFGLCLYTDFNMFTDIVLAKKSINILNKMNGRNLRLVFKSNADTSLTAHLHRKITQFINSVARFASYSAGGGEGESTIRISYDLLSNTAYGFTEILSINDAIQGSRNVGVAINIAQQNNESYKNVVRHVNGHELTFNHLAISEAMSESHVDALQELIENYYFPICVDVSSGEFKSLNHLIHRISGIDADPSLIDFTKLSYPSSVARVFRSYGTTTLTPDRDIVAGEVGTWTYTYTVGKDGIKENGGIRMAFHHSTDWELFQLDQAESDGYVSVSKDSKASIESTICFINACWYICIKVEENELVEGDSITLVIGDTSKGSRGSRSQTFKQKEFKFFTQVDATGTGIFFEHPQPISVDVLASIAKRICVVVPSVVAVDEHFTVKVRVEDLYHNCARAYKSKLTLRIEGETRPIEIHESDQEKNAVFCFEDIFFSEGGSYRFIVSDESGLSGISNYIVCSDKSPEYRVYWGDIHGHLGYMDSVGTVDDYYDYAKNVSFLDFTCHSEHMDSFSGGRQSSLDLQWEIVKAGTKKYNDEGRFVTILGYENSEIWDANIYFEGDDAPWHVDSYANRLFEFAKNHNAIVVPHMTTYPQRKRGYDWSNYDEQVVPVAEIYSTHGSSEYFGGEMPLKNCEPGGYIVEALDRGHKLGFIGSGDGHSCMPGNSRLMETDGYMNGLVAVFTKDLTRIGIFNAIKERRCYATTNARILARFSIDGSMMGSEISKSFGEAIAITYALYGTNMIEQIDIVRNGTIIHSSKEINSCSFKKTITDSPNKTGHNYYYVRMKQVDGEMAWLSPIFIDVKERENEKKITDKI